MFTFETDGTHLFACVPAPDSGPLLTPSSRPTTAKAQTSKTKPSSLSLLRLSCLALSHFLILDHFFFLLNDPPRKLDRLCPHARISVSVTREEATRSYPKGLSRLCTLVRLESILGWAIGSSLLVESLSICGPTWRPPPVKSSQHRRQHTSGPFLTNGFNSDTAPWFALPRSWRCRLTMSLYTTPQIRC